MRSLGLAAALSGVAAATGEASMATLRGTTARRASDAKWNPFGGMGFDYAADDEEMPAAAQQLPSMVAAAPDAHAIFVPGEGMVTDEMYSAAVVPKQVTLAQYKPQETSLLAQGKPYAPPLINRAAAGYPLPAPHGMVHDGTWLADEPYHQKGRFDPAGLVTASASRHPKVLKEYDEEMDETTDQDTDDLPDQVKDEKFTMDDMRRKRHHDVDRAHPERYYVKRDQRPLLHGPHYVPHRHPHPVPRQTVAATQHKVEAQPKQQPGPALQLQQCMNFATFLKAQGVDGTEFVRMWSGTCQPAVMAGTASPEYSKMCTTLIGSVSQFAAIKLWDPAAVCQAACTAFRDSGIGASPLR